MARKPTKALEDQGYSKLDSYCIGLNEFYKSLRKSGFGESGCAILNYRTGCLSGLAIA